MSYHKINAPRIVHEEVDGEIIVIDTVTGSYYSLRGSAARIWRGLVRGASPEEIAARCFKKSGAGDDQRLEQIREFALRLVKDELLVIEPRGSGQFSEADLKELPPEEFQPPVLEKFDDMRHYMLVDPIHEVTEKGWPHKKEEDDRSS